MHRKKKHSKETFPNLSQKVDILDKKLKSTIVNILKELKETILNKIKKSVKMKIQHI